MKYLMLLLIGSCAPTEKDIQMLCKKKAENSCASLEGTKDHSMCVIGAYITCLDERVKK